MLAEEQAPPLVVGLARFVSNQTREGNRQRHRSAEEFENRLLVPTIFQFSLSKIRLKGSLYAGVTIAASTEKFEHIILSSLAVVAAGLVVDAWLEENADYRRKNEATWLVS
jgi:hypothetical protein